MYICVCLLGATDLLANLQTVGGMLENLELAVKLVGHAITSR